MQEKSSLFDDKTRLAIFHAVQAGNLEEVTRLLDSNANLLTAQTKSKGHSLLHIAADYQRKNICELLLSRGHAPNPVNFDGKTPYDIVKNKDPEIRGLLVAAHTNAIFKNTCFDRELPNNVSYNILDKPSFFSFILSKTTREEIFLPTVFGVTLKPSNSSNISEFLTIFREEALMIHYFGELLVAHEEQQVQNFLTSMSLCEREIVAYAHGIHTLLRVCPQVVNFPLKEDKNHIIHAKKLIIASAILGFASYTKELQKSDAQKFQELMSKYPAVREVYQIALEKINGAHNLAHLRQLLKEIEEIYGADDQTSSVICRK